MLRSRAKWHLVPSSVVSTNYHSVQRFSVWHLFCSRCRLLKEEIKVVHLCSILIGDKKLLTLIYYLSQSLDDVGLSRILYHPPFQESTEIILKSARLWIGQCLWVLCSPEVGRRWRGRLGTWTRCAIEWSEGKEERACRIQKGKINIEKEWNEQESAVFSLAAWFCRKGGREELHIWSWRLKLWNQEYQRWRLWILDSAHKADKDLVFIVVSRVLEQIHHHEWSDSGWRSMSCRCLPHDWLGFLRAPRYS